MFFQRSNEGDKAVVAALNASQAVIEFTPGGDILTANDNFLACVGYRLDEIAGRHHSLLCDPDYVASDAYRGFWRDLAAGQFRSDVFKRIGKGGRVVWLQASYNPIRDKTGKVVRCIGAAVPGAVGVAEGALKVREPRDPTLPPPPGRASAMGAATVSAAASGGQTRSQSSAERARATALARAAAAAISSGGRRD